MTDDGVNDAPALKKADIGSAVADSTEAACSASDIVLIEPAWIYVAHSLQKIDFLPFMVLMITVLTDGSSLLHSLTVGSSVKLMTVVFFYAANESNFFTGLQPTPFNMLDDKVSTDPNENLASAVYLQVNAISLAIIFVARSRGWSFTKRLGFLLVVAFIIAQLIATVISDTANWKFAGIKSLGWGWTWVIWLFNIVTYLTPDPLNFAVRDMHSGLHSPTKRTLAREFMRLQCWLTNDQQRVIHTLKGKVESFAKLRGYDIDAMNNHYTL
ncbi:hypothetical protein Q3G72_014885 [Acer saccharum]|nr:hypothetical protein Q3G72_014885 [Acer saccharum]